MSNIIKRNNARVANFGSVVDQIFQNNLSNFFDDSFWGLKGIPGQDHTPVNIRETDKSYEMELVAPGLRKEDFKLNVSGETLTIAFEHEEEQNDPEASQGWIRREYKKRSFSRSFQLGDTVDANNISARYENGMLQLIIPKNERAQNVSRNISIQ
jgi:HSP20 family protein